MESDIAIVGMSCRLPGASNVEAFWSLLSKGESAISEVPRERWDLARVYDADPLAAGKANTRWGGFIDGAELFDAEFFAMSPEEAVIVDPQQRLMLELAWEALEHAGIDPQSLRRSAAGVYVGISHNDYERIICRDQSRITRFHGTGAYQSMAANRLSYFLDTVGPSMTLDTACSSGLAALHVACQQLRSREAPLAIVGAVTLHLTPEETIGLAKGKLLSPDGQCRSFDEGANGYVRAEGGVSLVLRRLDDALAEGLRVLSVIKGSAVNHNGRSNGLSAPNSPALVAVMQQALAAAGIEPGHVGFVETHGTGTALGDQLELKALREVYGQPGSETSCWLGCLKTNMGHLETTSGLAALIKATLAIRHGAIPPNLNFTRPPANANLASTRLVFPTQLEPWPVISSTRRAAVTAYGFGGANAHVLLEAPPSEVPAAMADCVGPQLLCISSATAAGHKDLLARYAEHLERPDGSLADICFTAAVGRAQFGYRSAFLANSLQDAADQVRARLIADTAEGASSKRLSLVYFFGAHAGVPAGNEWWQRQQAYRAAWQECVDCAPSAGPDGDDVTTDVRILEFAHAFALARLWASWGVRPAAVAGRGIGVLVAAAVAGLVSPAQVVGTLIGGRAPRMDAKTRVSLLDADTGEVVPIEKIDLAAYASRNAVTTGAPNFPDHDVAVNIGADGNAEREILQNLKQLFLAGVKLPWSQIYAGRSRKRVDAPLYPFQRKRHWFDPIPQTSAESSSPIVRAVPTLMPAATKPAPVSVKAPAVAQQTRTLHGSADLSRWIAELLAARLNLPATAIDVNSAFSDFGMDSAAAVAMAMEIEDHLGIKLDVTALWSYPNVAALARYLASLLADRTNAPKVSAVVAVSPSVAPADSSDTSRRLSIIEQLRRELLTS
ncbi:type I polyketide synthase [Polaromonas sp. JS666]|uniref:type I polyketide synthase n=1 Tax=Polaromonas sp. (strain JS666 / ATCC BAA-500) TaxID=296591 RepID=UPI00004646A7|nr:beta-ketoacyl synthase N-terminal-like domain-containing protein [Polaromonas sp. JS666]ABE47180.1 beta-ketoacyl synthase [Polaromonas sp. JS666]